MLCIFENRSTENRQLGKKVLFVDFFSMADIQERTLLQEMDTRQAAVQAQLQVSLTELHTLESSLKEREAASSALATAETERGSHRADLEQQQHTEPRPVVRVRQLYHFGSQMKCFLDTLMIMIMMYLFKTVPHPHGHWQLQEPLGN